MRSAECVACLTTGAAAGVLLLGLGTLRAAFRARRRPPVRRNYDVLAPTGPRTGARFVTTDDTPVTGEMQMGTFGPWAVTITRPEPPAPNPMTETLVVARPLGWDAQPRKEY